jgi:hypothetical protein
MREIIRQDVLWREVIPLAVVALIVAVIFIIAMVNDEDLGDAGMAVSWTMQAVGALIAIVATFGLFWRALNGASLEAQFGFVLAVLAGLLLIDIHWALAIALGLIGVALIAREIWSRHYPGARATDASYSAPENRPLP